MTRRAGFTLFELVVSLTVLSVVSTLAVSALVSAGRYWNELQAAAELDRHATAALESLRADFGNVLSSQAAPAPLRGRTGAMVDDSHSWRSTFEDDRLEMCVEQYNAATRQFETATVAYRVDRSGGTPRLVRGARGQSVSETVVAPGVAGLRFSWFDGRQWVDAWERSGLPRAVRVSVSVVDPAAPGRNIARAAEFRVSVP